MVKPGASTGPNVISQDVHLKASDTGRISVAVVAAMLVPAGNLFGVSITFHSGDTYTPYNDTAYISSAVTPGKSYKYGMFRPLLMKEKLTAFPTYIQENFNSGQYRQLPEASTNLGIYSPLWSWSANNAPSSYQYPYVDIKVRCATCRTLSAGKVPPVASLGNAYPNPANNAVTIPVIVKNDAEVELTITNVVGQAVTTQNLGLVKSTQPTRTIINTTGYANGVYFVTAKAKGSQMTNRFLVAH